jgi:soluble lytic murein transglycosylase-like protein
MAASLGARASEVAVLQNGFEIRHERRDQAGTSTRLYLSADPNSDYVDVPTEQIVDFRHEESDSPPSPSVTTLPKLSPEDLEKLVNAAGSRHMIDPDLISSVIHAESNFDPQARSPKGAQGLMQLMPDTASRLGVSDAFQPDANIDAGTRYLRQLLLRYDDDLVKALAAYNAGPERVEQYRGVPPFRETHAYVARVIRDFNRKKLAQNQAQAPLPAAAKAPARARKAARKRKVAAGHSAPASDSSNASSGTPSAGN